MHYNAARRERETGRTHQEPNYTGPNRAKRRERTSTHHAGALGTLTRIFYVITKELRSLIPAKSYCPPARHHGKHTQPVRKKGKR